MLIKEEEIRDILNKNNITLNAVLHIGAHECEELSLYENLGISRENIIWIDGNLEKVKQAQNLNIPNVHYGLISNEDDKEIEFNITNNGQSSSILQFGSHSKYYPWIHYIEKQLHKTITIDTFYERNNINMEKYDFWNFDIQGAELLALKGGLKALEHVKVLYLEVNIEEVYKGCALIDELDRFLSNYRFKRVLTKMTENGWGDALYIKEL